MLQAKLRECMCLMAEVSQNKQIDLENQNIARRNNTFFDAYNKYFVPTIKSYIVCKNYENVSFSDGIQYELKKYVEDSKKVFEQKTVINPAKYQEGIKKLSEKIANEWNRQIEEYLINIKEELGILKLVSNEKQKIQKILVCMNNFSKWPIEKEAYEQYQLAYETASDILLKMHFDDEEVLLFLKKVKNKEATLEDLSDRIIEWIRQENLSGNIMLSIKN